MAVRRAAARLEAETVDWDRSKPLASDALAALLRKASVNELPFMRLTVPGVQNEMIDLAYDLLGEQRPGGRAVQCPES
jgi:hypothetical protein